MTAQGRRSQAAQAYRAWYGTQRWKDIRASQLAAQPWCAYCLDAGHRVAAVACDHRERHGGDPVRFWSGPFQSLCRAHHDSSKKREEHKGFSGAVGVDGWPLDDRHPSNTNTT
jgi:5-methylcytosine-specific restriction protein A